MFCPFVEAKAEIHGPRDLYVKMGSLVTLSCKVSQGPHELGTIFWYRGKHSFSEISQILRTNYNNLRLIGSQALDPKAGTHPNDATYEYPGRISVDTEWTDSLRSRYKKSFSACSTFAIALKMLCLTHNILSRLCSVTHIRVNFRLKISSAMLTDSGNYSCMPTTAEGDSVTVHIINGEFCVCFCE